MELAKKTVYNIHDMGDEEKLYDVMILGGGPAGLSAALYAGRAGLSTLVIERGTYGGAIYLASKVDNYPGGIPGESGPEFAARLYGQAEKFGAEMVSGSAVEADISEKVKRIKTHDKTYQGRTLIIATGSAPKKLGISGEEEFIGRGVSYCAVCDGRFFSGSDVFVIGGDNSALEESLYLSNLVRHVTIIHRKDGFRADEQLENKAREKENISFLPDTIVTKIAGDDLITRIETKNLKTGETGLFEADEGENFGLFFPGMRPMSELFMGIDTEKGYIVTDESMKTGIPGVFAAGDVRKKALRQIVTAAADGAIAAIEAEKYISEED